MQPLIISKNPIVPSVDQIERCSVNSSWTKAAILTTSSSSSENENENTNTNNNTNEEQLFLVQFSPGNSNNNNTNTNASSSTANNNQQPSSSLQNILLSENPNPPVSSTICLIGDNKNNNTSTKRTKINDLAWCSKELTLYVIGNDGHDLICFNFDDPAENANLDVAAPLSSSSTSCSIQDFDFYPPQTNDKNDNASSSLLANWAVSVPYEVVEAACFSQNRDEPTKLEKGSTVSDLNNMSFGSAPNERKILGVRTDPTRLGVWIHLQSLLVSFQFIIKNNNVLHCVSARRVPLPSSSTSANSTNDTIWCVGPTSVVTLNLPQYENPAIALMKQQQNQEENSTAASSTQQQQILNTELMVWDISGSSSVCIAHIPLMLENFFIPKFSFSTNNINNNHNLIRRNITLHFGGDGVDTIIIFDGDRGTASWFDLTLEERKQQQRSKTSAASTRAARFDQTSLGAHDPVALMLQPVSDSNRFYSWNSFRARFDPSLRQMFAHSLNFVYLEDDEENHNNNQMMLARNRSRSSMKSSSKRRQSFVMNNNNNENDNTNTDELLLIQSSSTCKLLELHNFDGPNGEIWIYALLMFMKPVDNDDQNKMKMSCLKSVVISAKDNKRVDEVTFQLPCVPIEHVGGGGSGGSHSSFIYSSASSTTAATTTTAMNSSASSNPQNVVAAAGAGTPDPISASSSSNHNNTTSLQLQQQLLQMNSLHLCSPILFEEGVSAVALLEGNLSSIAKNSNNQNNQNISGEYNNNNNNETGAVAAPLTRSGHSSLSASRNDLMALSSTAAGGGGGENFASAADFASSSGGSSSSLLLNALIQKFAHRAASATRILCRLNEWDDASVREATLINAANLSQGSSGSSSSSSPTSSTSKNNEMALANELSNLLNFSLDDQKHPSSSALGTNTNENLLLLIDAQLPTQNQQNQQNQQILLNPQTISISPDLAAALSACSTLHKFFSRKYKELNLEDLVARERFEILVTTGVTYAEKLAEKIMSIVMMSNAVVSEQKSKSSSSSKPTTSTSITTKINLDITSEPRRVEECTKQYNQLHQLQQQLAAASNSHLQQFSELQQQQQILIPHSELFTISPLSLVVSLLESWCRVVDCIRFCVKNGMKHQPSYSDAILRLMSTENVTKSTNTSSTISSTQPKTRLNEIEEIVAEGNKFSREQQQQLVASSRQSRTIFIQMVKKILTLVEQGRISAANQQLSQVSGLLENNNHSNIKTPTTAKSTSMISSTLTIPEITAILLQYQRSISKHHSSSSSTTTCTTKNSFDRVKFFVEAVASLVLSSCNSSDSSTSTNNVSTLLFSQKDIQTFFMCVAKLFPIRINRDMWFTQTMCTTDSFIVRNRIAMMTGLVSKLVAEVSSTSSSSSMTKSKTNSNKRRNKKHLQTVTFIRDCFNLLGNETDSTIVKLVSFSSLRKDFVEKAVQLFPQQHQQMPIVFRVVDNMKKTIGGGAVDDDDENNKNRTKNSENNTNNNNNNYQITAVTGVASSFPLRVMKSESEDVIDKTIQQYHVSRIEQLVFQHYSKKTSSSSSSSLFDALLPFFENDDDNNENNDRQSFLLLNLFTTSVLKYSEARSDLSVAFVGGRIVAQKISNQKEKKTSLVEHLVSTHDSDKDNINQQMVRAIFVLGTGSIALAKALNLSPAKTALFFNNNNNNESTFESRLLEQLFEVTSSQEQDQEQSSLLLRSAFLILADNFMENNNNKNNNNEEDHNNNLSTWKHLLDFLHHHQNNNNDDDKEEKDSSITSLRSWLHDQATIRTLTPSNQDELLQVSDSSLRLFSSSSSATKTTTLKKLIAEILFFFSMTPRGYHLRDHSDTLAECCTYNNNNKNKKKSENCSEEELVVFHAVKNKELFTNNNNNNVMGEIVDGFVLGKYSSLENVTLSESCVRILKLSPATTTPASDEKSKKNHQNDEEDESLLEENKNNNNNENMLVPNKQHQNLKIPRWTKLLKQLRIFGATTELLSSTNQEQDDNNNSKIVEQVLLACQDIFIAHAQQLLQQQLAGENSTHHQYEHLPTFFAENNTLLFLNLLGYKEHAQNILRSFEMARSEHEEDENNKNNNNNVVDIIQREIGAAPWLCLICSSSAEHDADLESEKKTRFKSDAKEQKWARFLQHAFIAKLINDDDGDDDDDEDENENQNVHTTNKRKMKQFLFELLNTANAPAIQAAVFPKQSMEVAISSSRKLFSSLASSSLAITMRNSSSCASLSPTTKNKSLFSSSEENQNQEEQQEQLMIRQKLTERKKLAEQKKKNKRRNSSASPASSSSTVNSSSSWGRRICANINTRAFLRDTGIDSLNNNGRGMVVARAILLALNASRSDSQISTQLESFFMSATSTFSEINELSFPVALSVLQKLFTLSSPFPFFVAYRVVTELGENLLAQLSSSSSSSSNMMMMMSNAADSAEFILLSHFCRSLQLLADERYAEATEYLEVNIVRSGLDFEQLLFSKHPGFIDWLRLSVVRLSAGSRSSASNSSSLDYSSSTSKSSSSSTHLNASAYSVVQSLSGLLRAVPHLGERFYFSPHGAGDAVVALEVAMKTCLDELTRTVSSGSSSSSQSRTQQQQQPQNSSSTSTSTTSVNSVFDSLLAIAREFSKQATEPHLSSEFTTKVWSATRTVDDLQLPPHQHFINNKLSSSSPSSTPSSSIPSSPISATATTAGSAFGDYNNAKPSSSSSLSPTRKFRSPREVWNYVSQGFSSAALFPGSTWSCAKERGEFIHQMYTEWMSTSSSSFSTTSIQENNSNNTKPSSSFMIEPLGYREIIRDNDDDNNDDGNQDDLSSPEIRQQILENEEAQDIDDFFGQIANPESFMMMTTTKQQGSSSSSSNSTSLTANCTLNLSRISAASSPSISVSGLMIWLVAFTIPLKDLSFDILIELARLRLRSLTTNNNKNQNDKSDVSASSSSSSLSEQRLKHLISVLTSFRDHNYRGGVSSSSSAIQNNDDKEEQNAATTTDDPASLRHLFKYVLNACLVRQEVPEVELEGHLLQIHDACPTFDEMILEKPIVGARAIRMLDSTLFSNFFFKQWLGRTFAVPRDILSTFGGGAGITSANNKSGINQNKKKKSNLLLLSPSELAAKKQAQKDQLQLHLTTILKPFVGQDQASDISQFMNPNTVSSTLRDILAMPCTAWRPFLNAENPKNYANIHDAELVLSSSDSPLFKLTNFEVASLEKKIEAVQLLLSRLHSQQRKQFLKDMQNQKHKQQRNHTSGSNNNIIAESTMTPKQRDGIVSHVVSGIFACWLIPLLGYRNPEDAARITHWATRQLSVLSESYQPAVKAFCCTSETFPIKPTSKVAQVLNMDDTGFDLRIKCATMLWSNEVDNLVRLLLILGGDVNEECVLPNPTMMMAPATTTAATTKTGEKSSTNTTTANNDNASRALFTSIHNPLGSTSDEQQQNANAASERELQEQALLVGKMRKKLSIFKKYLPSSQVLLQKLFDLVSKCEDSVIDSIEENARFSEARLFLTTVGWKLINERISTANATTSSSSVVDDTNSSTSSNLQQQQQQSSSSISFLMMGSNSPAGSPASKAHQASSSATAVGRSPQNNRILVTEAYLKLALGLETSPSQQGNSSSAVTSIGEDIENTQEDIEEEEALAALGVFDNNNSKNKNKNHSNNSNKSANSITNNSNSSSSLSSPATIWDPMLIARYVDEAQHSIYCLLQQEDLCPIGRFLYSVDDPVWFLTPLLNHLFHVNDYNATLIVPLSDIVHTQGTNYVPLTDSPTRLALLHYFLAAADFSVSVCDTATEMYSYFGHNAPLASGLEHQAWTMLQSFVKTQQELVGKTGGGQGPGSGKNDQNAAMARRLEKLLDEVIISFEQAAEAFFHSELYDKCLLCVQTIRILDAQKRELLIQAQSPSTSTGGVMITKSGGFFSRSTNNSNNNSSTNEENPAADIASNTFNSVAHVGYSAIPQDLLRQINAEVEQAKQDHKEKSSKRSSRPSNLFSNTNKNKSSMSNEATNASSVGGGIGHPTTPEFNNTPNSYNSPSSSKNNNAAASSSTSQIINSEFARRQLAIALAPHVSDPLSLLLIGSGCEFNVENWTQAIHSFVVAQSQISTNSSKSSSSGGLNNLALKHCQDIINYYKDSCVTVAAELPSRMRAILLNTNANATTNNNSSTSWSSLVVAPGTQKVVWEEMIRILEKS